MFRGYRRYVFAALGCLTAILGYASYQLYDASEQQRANYHYEPARQQGRLIVLPGKTYPKGYQPNCDNPQGKENADLCAQWAAVDQVMEANRLASVNVKLALFISILTFIGTGFVGWTFWEARTTSRRELRAYLFVEGITLGRATSGPKRGVPGGVIVVKNFGQTPAYDVRHYGVIEVIDVEKPVFTEIPDSLENIAVTALPKDGTLTAIRDTGERIVASQMDQIRKGTMVIAARGRIEYRDTFHADRWTSYHYYYTGKWPPPESMVMNIANTGNESDQSGKKLKHTPSAS